MAAALFWTCIIAVLLSLLAAVQGDLVWCVGMFLVAVASLLAATEVA